MDFQQGLQLFEQGEHVGSDGIGKNRIGDDVDEALFQPAERESGPASRIDEEALAAAKEPVRPRVGGLSPADGAPVDIDAPVAFLVDRGTGVPQHVADVSPKIQHVLAVPTRIAKLRREIIVLTRFL